MRFAINSRSSNSLVNRILRTLTHMDVCRPIGSRLSSTKARAMVRACTALRSGATGFAFARTCGVVVEPEGVMAKVRNTDEDPRCLSEDEYPTATLEGFTIGMCVSYHDCGDAWVRAPDGSVGTLVWEIGEPSYFREMIAPDSQGRWGAYAVQLPLPLTNDHEASEYLAALLPELRQRWEAWKVPR